MINLLAYKKDMTVSEKSINRFLMFRLPLAFIAGVRLRSLDEERSLVTVKFRWMNQNPFKSMYFAVQSMAAELTTGALLMKHISESGHSISMLVTNYNASFHKKAVGRIRFDCEDGSKISGAIENAIQSVEGQVIKLRSKGINEDGIVVSEYRFEWSIKLKNNN